MVRRQPADNEWTKPAGWRIAVAGTGGQGVLTAARLLCDAFAGLGHEVVSSQLRGMAQRGGSVQSSVVIDGGISPVIASGAADVVLGFEPIETARVLPLMSPRTLVFMNTRPVMPFILAQQTVLEEREAKYPDVGELAGRIRSVAPDTRAFDATELAIDAGSIRTLNVVMLGCLLGSGRLPCPAERFWSTLIGITPPPLAETNRRAFFGGVRVGNGLRLAGAR